MPIIRFMTYEQVLSHYGSAANIARAYQISTASVAGWRIKGVPEVRQFQIELMTSGVLVADRSRQNEKSTG